MFKKIKCLRYIMLQTRGYLAMETEWCVWPGKTTET